MAYLSFMDLDLKRCGHCKLEKPRDDFYNSKDRKDGKAHNCKQCMKEYADAHRPQIQQRSKDWYDNNKERSNAKNQQWRIDNHARKLETDRAWRENNKEHLRKIQKEWVAKNRDKHRAGQRRRHLQNKFGLSEEQFDKLMISQHNMCAVCHVTFDLSMKVLSPHVDHCHNAGHVRGLLCGNCNSAEGLLQTITNVKSLLKYMQKNELFYAA